MSYCLLFSEFFYFYKKALTYNGRPRNKIPDMAATKPSFLQLSKTDAIADNKAIPTEKNIAMVTPQTLLFEVPTSS